MRFVIVLVCHDCTREDDHREGKRTLRAGRNRCRSPPARNLYSQLNFEASNALAVVRERALRQTELPLISGGRKGLGPSHSATSVLRDLHLILRRLADKMGKI
jgi:hypothetical protein